MQQAPYLSSRNSVTRVMLWVLLALLPGIGIHVWFYGPMLLLNILMTSVSAVGTEALFLFACRRPVVLFLRDLSVLVTAWLIAVSFPVGVPGWLLVVGTIFAVIVGKHLYGGLGQNPFNPAMLAYVVCLISFPAWMSHWPTVLAGGDGLWAFLQAAPNYYVDVIASATPLDTLKTQLSLGNATDVVHIMQDRQVFGIMAGRGSEWVALGWLIGGLGLLWLRVITWRLPLSYLFGITLMATVFWWVDPSHFASPGLHLLAGGTLLGAWFIVTDPVSGSTTPRGRIVFGLGAGILTYVIRVLGGYPDGVAFAVLLMNIAVPLIDRYTQPSVFGHKSGSQ